MAQNPQYDSSLGGNVALPFELTVAKFTAARGKEIQLMRQSLSSNTGGVKLAFQRLPKHMRRRAMSHNAKRLPRRLREIHLSQLKKSGMPPKSKRPSRKYRRKPYNLLNEYLKRQAKVRWLHTHIWHAKRFHMVQKWGYKLPNRACDKAYRACYRATAKHCLIQDISYYSCVEIKGNFNVIQAKLKGICDTGTALSIVAKCYIKGGREGKCTLFNSSNGDRKAVGQISFMWRPEYAPESPNKALWLWVHPAFYEEALNILSTLFSLQENKEIGDDSHSRTFIGCDNIKVTELRTNLSRFHLTGPLSNCLLHTALQTYDKDGTSDIPWYSELYNSSEQIADQHKFWNNIKNSKTSNLSPRIICSLLVNDPRFNIPKKRTKAWPDGFEDGEVDLPNELAFSPLWDENIRQYVQENKFSYKKINELRGDLLVPGSELEYNGTPLPLLLVQRPGSKCNNVGYTSGWDIILPSAWSQPLWTSLVMWGARAGGLRETNSTQFELGLPSILQPDTLGGATEESNVGIEYKNKYFRRPPNKRINFNKLSIASPFEYKWSLLVKEWSNDNESNEFVVLRDRQILQKLQNCLTSKCDLPKLPKNYLIPVKVVCHKKGIIKPFSIICLPKTTDSKLEPVEPKKVDQLQELRKKFRHEHQHLLKRLRRQRVRAKKNSKEFTKDNQTLFFNSMMRDLWLPEAKTIRHSCSREVIGFVQEGDFSFSLGKSSGVGYLTFGSLTSLLNLEKRNRVLVRNTNTRQYRFAELNIITEL